MSETFDFGGYLSTYRSENKPKVPIFGIENAHKSRHFKVKKTQILPKLVKKIFVKVHKTNFFDPQNGQNTGVNLAKKKC